MQAVRILLLSVSCGLLWALSWPGIGGIAPLAFVAWLPLFHAERLHRHRAGERRRHFWPWVLPALFVWNLSCSWWFYLVSEPLATKLVSVAAPVVVNTLLMSLPWLGRRWVDRAWGPRAAAWAFMAFWLAFERLHHDWDLQWPWLSLGNVFGSRPAWVQWYEVTGMLGGSLWVLLVNLLIDGALVARRGSDARSMRRWGLAAAGALVLPLSLSLLRHGSYQERGEAVEVVVLQPNVDPYTEKFGGIDPLEQLDSMLWLAAETVTPSTRLVVLPETALQERSGYDVANGELELLGLWENDLEASASARRIRAFLQRHPNVALLAGMSSNTLLPPGAEPPVWGRPLGSTGRWYESSNAAMFVPSSGPIAHYRKSKLVAGVESMPFERFTGPLSELALDLGGTTGSLAGQEERSVLSDAASGLRIAPAICYESVFGEHLAAHVRNGANLVVIMTNDGWWGDSPGYRQHLLFAPLRAIENRRAIARAANTGISCVVDQRGTIHQAAPWWEPASVRAAVHLNEATTFFTRQGDLVGRTGVAVSIAVLGVLAALRFRRGFQNRATRRAMGSPAPSKRTT